MKKDYIAPMCDTYTLPTGKLFLSVDSTKETDDGSWSKQYGGGLFEDDTEVNASDPTQFFK